MNFLDEALTQYSEKHTSPMSPVLNELERETWYSKIYPRMLSGHLQGTFLRMISQMIVPQYILEIGTFTGYSAIELAKGLKPNGQLVSIDTNEEHQLLAKKYIEKAGLSDRIILKTGEAKTILPALKNTWDLVFIDADKTNYSLYFDLVIDKVTPGGWLIADNVLWSGKVLDNVKNKDKDTKALCDFNSKIAADHRVDNLLLPFRDGLMVIRKN